MTARRLLVGYAVIMAVLGLLYYVLPPLGNHVAWLVIGLTSSAAVLVGVAVNRPRRRAPWIMLSLATLAFTAGDTSYAVLTEVLHEENPYPSFPEIFYQIYYLLLVLTLIMLPHAHRVLRDRSALLDALTVTVGFGLLAWVLLIGRHLRDPETPMLTKAASVALPLWDVLLLAVITRFAATVRRSWTVRLLLIGLVGLLASDVVFALHQVNSMWQVGGPTDLGWYVLYVCTGAAALHPSMVTLTRRSSVWQTKISWRRIVVLALATLIPPMVLLVEALSGNVTNGVVIALTSAAMFLLVAGRLALVVFQHRRALEREQGLREAGAALVRADDVGQVRDAVHRAVQQLVGRQESRVLFVATTEDSPADDVATVARMTELATSEGDGLTRVMSTDALDPPMARLMRPHDAVLVRPLAVPDAVAGLNLLGVVAVASRYALLLTLRESLELLGFQASLALERIALGLEVDRRNSEDYFRSLVGNSGDVIVIIDDNDQIRNASPTALSMFGRTVVGANLLELLHPDDVARARSQLESAKAGAEVTVEEWRLLHPEEDGRHAEVSCRDLRGDRAIHGLVVTLRDVTARRGLERELSHRASHDALTGLANRDSFRQLVDQTIGVPVPGRVVGAIQIDLDDFKIINETAGYDAGDRALVAIAHRLTDLLGDHDLAARFGADEFALLVGRANDPKDIETVAQRVVGIVADPIDAAGSPVRVTASVGVATSAEAADAAELLRQADLALLVAKTEGKNQWRRYQRDKHESVLERHELRRELAEAMDAGALTVMLQPIADLRSGLARGFEALVRWQHPTRGMIAPDRFIAVAEESGQISRLGTWVLHDALGHVTHLRREGGDVYVSVNVSAHQFRTPGFAGEIHAALASCHLPAAALVLEITESLFLEGDEQVWADLAALRRAGVRIAIDDFGTGYSSLSYLHRVPVDIIKIDRSFVDGVTTDPQRRKLVDGILRLAASLDLETVAEGVEAEPDRELLVEMGCRLGQGYLYAKPLSPDDAQRWLADHQTA